MQATPRVSGLASAASEAIDVPRLHLLPRSSSTKNQESRKVVLFLILTPFAAKARLPPCFLADIGHDVHSMNQVVSATHRSRNVQEETRVQHEAVEQQKADFGITQHGRERSAPLIRASATRTRPLSASRGGSTGTPSRRATRRTPRSIRTTPSPGSGCASMSLHRHRQRCARGRAAP